MNQKIIANTAIILPDSSGGAIRAEISSHPSKPSYVLGRVGDLDVAVAWAGKGGVEINKLASGRVLAVAADGFRPAYEKDEQGRPTKNQKKHGGRPLYLASGFYLMSTKDYTAHTILSGYMRLMEEGSLLAYLEPQSAGRTHALASRDDLLDLHRELVSHLKEEGGVVTDFDEVVNKRRQRLIRRAQEDAEDGGVALEPLVQYRQLAADPKDCSPCVVLFWRDAQGRVVEAIVQRRIDRRQGLGPEMALGQDFVSAKEAAAAFWGGESGSSLSRAVKAGHETRVFVAKGWVYRTSVAFKKKVASVMQSRQAPSTGEGVWIEAAHKGWVMGYASILSMLHPQFPHKDYDTLHYVAAPRQAEMEMEQTEAGLRPRAIVYDAAALAKRLGKGAPA